MNGAFGAAQNVRDNFLASSDPYSPSLKLCNFCSAFHSVH